MMTVLAIAEEQNEYPHISFLNFFININHAVFFSWRMEVFFNLIINWHYIIYPKRCNN